MQDGCRNDDTRIYKKQFEFRLVNNVSVNKSVKKSTQQNKVQFGKIMQKYLNNLI